MTGAIRSGAVLRALAIAVVATRHGCAEPVATPEPAVSQASASSEKLARLKHFWDLFQRATEARIAGDSEQALDLYTQALTIDPKHEDSLFYLGQCHRSRGEHQQALESWQRLVTLQPQAHRGFSQIGILLSSARAGAPFDLDGARQAFEAAFALNPEESGSMVRLGELAVATGDLALGADWLARGQRMNPREVAAPFLLGYVDWVSGDHAKASVDLAEAARRLQLEKPKAASFEGQTAKGAQALVEASSIGQSLLQPFWETWAQGRAPGSPVTPAEADAIYRAVNQFVVKLRAEGPDAARPLRPETS